MSTVNDPLKYLWTAQFEDGHVMNQPADDRSIDHDENAEHNGTAFTDLLNYDSPVQVFCLGSYALSLVTGEFFVFADPNTPVTRFKLEMEDEILTDRKLIYYRVVRKDTIIDKQTQEVQDELHYVHAYVIGYEGKDKNGKTVKKTILVE